MKKAAHLPGGRLGKNHSPSEIGDPVRSSPSGQLTATGVRLILACHDAVCGAELPTLSRSAAQGWSSTRKGE